MLVSEACPLTLLAAVFRTETVRRLGGGNRALGVSPTLVGGTEDADLLFRLCAAGHRGLFWPNPRIRHKVPAQRLTKAYFRRWHWGHGIDYARMRLPRFESSRRHLLGVPGHGRGHDRA